jgi:hypothetical protein
MTNNQLPFMLYTTNKTEFLSKKCSICLGTLYYPENNDKIMFCTKLNCNHIYHKECINSSINSLTLNNNRCPDCRTTITQAKDVTKSIELSIRKDAFINNNISEELINHFKNNVLELCDYEYHKIVFERWRKENPNK